MNLLYATSEAAPFVKTGGLGDVAGSLPVTLKEKGVDSRVILPLYRCIDQKYKDMMTYINHIYINIGWRKQYCGVFQMQWRGTTYYFVDNEYYFNGDKPYDYIHLDCEKFIFFSKAVLSLLPTLDFRPDVINCNDWQTAAIPVFLDTFYDNPFYRGIKTVMTIHNLRFQGRWDFNKIKDAMGIDDYYFTGDKLEYYKDANLLKGGLVYANKITTVSETYANEITTQEYGEGLDGLLSARRGDILGIVNGISEDWNPKTDTFIYSNYTQRSLAKKKINKTELQKELNLPVDENKFMIGIVSRLTDQKGFDLIAYAMEQLCEGGYQIVVLGTGDENYENMFRHFAWKYPDKVSANIYFSNELSHKIYAACDAFLMPSRFEPCGLSQLISMRYGTLPIVRETGGLADTVKPYNEFTGEGTGFSFASYNADDMMHVINYAMRTYYDNPTAWAKIVKNAMQQDFSWEASADKYITLYEQLSGISVQKKAEPTPKKTPAKKKTAAKKELSFDENIKADAEASEKTWAAEAAKKDKDALKAMTDSDKEKNIEEIRSDIEKNAVKAKKEASPKKPAAKKTASKTKKKAATKKTDKNA
ncbi:MAG: glycogen synthase GlgA [Clostridia bacterium]|nr:glycogen synthase GlgA [Clostridia bacterium]MBP3360103.1 glycogen synthase GlgA [Clostridia bacterium]